MAIRNQAFFIQRDGKEWGGGVEDFWGGQLGFRGTRGWLVVANRVAENGFWVVCVFDFPFCRFKALFPCRFTEQPPKTLYTPLIFLKN